jgi:hypothetical protein
MEMRGLWDEGYHWVSVSGIQVIDKKYSVIRPFYAFFDARTESLIRSLAASAYIVFRLGFFFTEAGFLSNPRSTPITTLAPTSLPRHVSLAWNDFPSA